MSYKLDGNCVVKENGTIVKCHNSRADAEAHMRALTANVPDASGKTSSSSSGSAASKQMNMMIRKAAGRSKL